MRKGRDGDGKKRGEWEVKHMHALTKVRRKLKPSKKGPCTTTHYTHTEGIIILTRTYIRIGRRNGKEPDVCTCNDRLCEEQ